MPLNAIAFPIMSCNQSVLLGTRLWVWFRGLSEELMLLWATNFSFQVFLFSFTKYIVSMSKYIHILSGEYHKGWKFRYSTYLQHATITNIHFWPGKYIIRKVPVTALKSLCQHSCLLNVWRKAQFSTIA